jgi:hypothetical protein
MPDELDFELRKADAAAEPIEAMAPERPVGPMIAAGLLAIAVIVAAYLVFGRTASAPVDQASAPPPVLETTEQAAAPLGGGAAAIDVPPLDESDQVVRGLVRELSSHPGVAAWLATDGLIRNFTVVVANIAEGSTPAARLRALAPSGPFRVVEQGDDLLVDPRSYERYDRLAEAVASVDPAGSARLYSTLKPRIEEAYRDLGLPEGTFDGMLERAIVSLLATPVTDSPHDLAPRGIVYGYADPRLESLTAAQKQLLRMGPRNARSVQRKLREIALALGIPSERLPPPR